MNAASVDDLVSRAVQLIGDRPGLLRADDSDGFADVFGWADLNHALETQRFDWPRLRLVAGGDAVPIEDYTREVQRRTGVPYRAIDPGRVQAILFGGATLVIDGVDQLHDGVRRIASAIEGQVRAHAFVNLYASWGTEGGFNLHWDDHEVVVIHLAGAKAWDVFPPTRRWPLWLDVDDASRPDDADEHDALELEAGDVLYVPHGWWHRAKPTRSPSLHLTIGIPRATGIDFLTWLTNRLRDDEVFREPLPLDGDADRGGVHLRKLISRIAGIDADAGTYRDFLNELDSEARPKLAYNLPGRQAGVEIDSQTMVAWTAPRAVIEVDETGAQLLTGGRRIALAAAAGPVLEYLKGAGTASVQRLRAEFSELDRDRLDGLLQELAKLAVIRLTNH